jgi:hypothetical protein
VAERPCAPASDAGGIWKPLAISAKRRSNVAALAACILSRNDVTAASLTALAIEFDAAAAVIDARTAAAQVIGYGDDIPPDTTPHIRQPN